MAHYSPRVLPEAFDVGGVIGQMLEGYDAGRQQRQETRSRKRRERLEDEDRSRRERQGRAEDLALPGAMTLGEALDRYQLTGGTLARVGNAAEQNVPLEFERPESQSLADFIPNRVPGAEPTGRELGGYTFQERAPYMTASGAVVSPQRAREQQTLATILDEQLKQSFKETPEERAARLEADARAGVRGKRLTPEQLAEDLDYAGKLAAAKRAPETPGEPEPPKSLNLLNRQITDTQRRLDFAFSTNLMPEERDGKVDPLAQAVYNEGRRRQRALETRMDSLVTERDRLSRDYMIKAGVAPPARDSLNIMDRTRVPPPATAEIPDVFKRPRGAMPRLDVTKPPTEERPIAIPDRQPPATDEGFRELSSEVQPPAADTTAQDVIPRASTPDEVPSDDILRALTRRFGKDADAVIAELKRLGYGTD